MATCSWFYPEKVVPQAEQTFGPANGVTPVARPIFETKNRAIFLERFFGRGITAREQLSRAVILARF